MPRTVAVTGAMGFIGSHLVRQLVDSGYRVRVLTRRLPVHPAYGARPVAAVIGDIEDSQALSELLRGADAVIHAAGLVKAPNRESFFAVNAAGTRHIVQTARAQAAPLRFILLSSLAAREPQLSAYAASKRAAETTLTQGAGGLSWNIVRPPAVYGPGDREILPFFRAALRGVIPIPGGVDNRLSMMHVMDLVRSVQAVMEDEATEGATLEIDDGKEGGYGWPELARIVGETLGTHPKLVRIPRFALYTVGFVNELSMRLGRPTAMLTRDKSREICHPDWVSRVDPLRLPASWRPSVPLESGFADTLAWYRRERWL